MNKQIYFLKPIGMDGPIKVGCSVLPKGRLKSLSLWSPFPLEVIATAPGGHGDENALHYLLREHQANGEWFHPNPKLAAIIADVQANGALPAFDTPPRNKRKGALKRTGNTEVSRAKANLTARISRAERHAYGYWRDGKRPEAVAAIIENYRQPGEPMPTGEALDLVETYAAGLLAKKRADVGIEAWREWHDHNLANRKSPSISVVSV